MQRSAVLALSIAITAILLAPLAHGAEPSAPVGNAELQRMFEEDQADRKAGLHGIDWSVVKPRDDARLKRTKELYAADALRTGADWFHAALILQHSSDADDYLLAHDMCIAALAQGDPRARWLAAATEDRFLRAIGRKQRFGTQYQSSAPGRREPLPTDGKVTDALRRAIGLPSLAIAEPPAAKPDQP